MKHLYRIILIFLGAFLLVGSGAQAALHISINPVEGGSTLRFGRVDGVMEANKAVRLRVTSDEGKQYQVYQRLQDPMINQENNYLGDGAVSSYAINGSNASGTLYGQSNEPLGQADQLVFTSSADGQGDTLTLAYVINPERVKDSGNFVGRIAYTVRSLSDGTQDQAVINVYLEAQGGFKVSVEGARYSNKILIRSSRREVTNDGIKINFVGNSNKEIRIYQEMEIFPVNEQGESLNLNSLQFSVVSSGGGNFHLTPEVLGRTRQLLYRSHESQEDVTVEYSLSPQSDAPVKAGSYRGSLRVAVESSSGIQEFPLDVEIQVDPVFDIEVALPSQGVRFNRVLPFDPPQTKEVLVKVISNLGKPYVVMQNVATPMVDAEGDQIKAEYFSLKTEITSKSEGKVAATDFVPVGVGEKAVFYSDAKGTPSEFKVIYRLQSYPDIRAGEYGAPIVFSLGEM